MKYYSVSYKFSSLGLLLFCINHSAAMFFQGDVLILCSSLRFFEDIELHKEKDSKYRFKKDGKKHTLIIQEATLDDIGMYHAWTNGGHTKGELEVEGTCRKSFILTHFSFKISFVVTKCG